MSNQDSGFSRREMLKGTAVAAAGAAFAAYGTASAAEAPATGKKVLARIQELLEGNQAVKWVFAGDSITHGARHLNGFKDYVQLFEERLRYEMGKERNLVIKTATSGWTVRRFLDDIEWRALHFDPQVISIHYGMNDCVGGPEALPAFNKQYREAIDRLRDETGAALVLHTPNAILPLDERRKGNLEPYVEAVREIAAEKDTLLVDNYAAWKEYGAKSQIFYLMNDAIHPNEYGHRLTAHLLFKRLGMWDPESATCRLYIPR